MVFVDFAASASVNVSSIYISLIGIYRFILD